MHGYVFELATGHLVAPRGLCDDQRRFVARFEGGDVVVWDPGPGVAIAGLPRAQTKIKVPAQRGRGGSLTPHGH